MLTQSNPALSSVTEVLAWLCTCSCFICCICGDGRKLRERIYQQTWNGDHRIPRMLNSGRTRGLDINTKGNKHLFPALKYSEQNKIIKLYFIPWKDKIFEMHLLCSKHFVYKTNHFSSSNSFLWKQFCHCPGYSDRQKTWSEIKKNFIVLTVKGASKHDVVTVLFLTYASSYLSCWFNMDLSNKSVRLF